MERVVTLKDGANTLVEWSPLIIFSNKEFKNYKRSYPKPPLWTISVQKGSLMCNDHPELFSLNLLLMIKFIVKRDDNMKQMI